MGNGRGSALVLACVFMFVSVAAMLMLHNHLRTILRVSEKESLLDKNPLETGLARGLSLLETGKPVNDYTCSYSTPAVALVFSKQSAKKWEVVSSTEDWRVEAASCTCPSVFETDASHLWKDCSPAHAH